MANISEISIGQLVRVVSVTKPANAFMVGQEVKVMGIERTTLMCASGSGTNPDRYRHSGRVCLSANQVEIV